MSKVALEIKDLSYSYQNFWALEDISFKVDEGDFLAIVGPNGSGKTTLLKLMMGLEKPSSGTMNIFGEAAHKAPSSYISYVPQNKSLDRSFPALGYELVASGLKASWPGRLKKSDINKVYEALDQIGGSQLAKKQLSQMSGGELQRLYLARALIRQPRILLLDEPSTGIDMVCESDINHLIDKINMENKTTIVMVTHNWATARHHADNALLLNRWQVAYGKSEEILTEEYLAKAFRHVESIGHSHHHGEDGRC